ncbi:nucleotidyltransferase domain-containing protein [Patescibacteria group bacterium]|nr:nucleotidyltransferase domain-containing protein [Patescibacteria group bacterium]
MKNIFFKTNAQKILRLLLEHPEELLLPSEIKKETKISRAGIHSALQELFKKGLIQRKQKGRAYIYQVQSELPALKQIKVLDSIMKLQPLVKKLNFSIEKIILFGSCSRGENIKESDIDLLIITHDKMAVKEKLDQFTKFYLKPIIKTPIEFMALEKKDPAFYTEINRGIILFEKNQE